MPSFLTNLFESLNSSALGSFKLIILGYIALLWISIIIWVTRDALARSNSILFQAFSILLTIGIPILGVFLYLIIRPSKTQMERYYERLEANVLEDEGKQIKNESPSCDKCLTEVHDDYVYCPNCAFQLKKICHSCKKAFDDKWSMCPYCGKEYKEKNSSPRFSKKTNSKKEKTQEIEKEEEVNRKNDPNSYIN